MQETIGIFLVNRGRILIGHPSKHPPTAWTIPKGRPEPNENHLDTAIREFKEEAGIDLSEFKDQMVFIGSQEYKNKNKKIFTYILKVETDFPEPKCESMVIDKGEPYFPELDGFKWATYEEAINLLFVTQKQLMSDHKNYFTDMAKHNCKELDCKNTWGVNHCEKCKPFFPDIPAECCLWEEIKFLKSQLNMARNGIKFLADGKSKQPKEYAEALLEDLAEEEKNKNQDQDNNE